MGELSRGIELTVPEWLKRLWPVLKVLIAVGLLVVIGLYIDWERFLELATGVRPLWLLPVLLVVVCDRAFMGVKWHYLMRGMGVRIELLETVYQYHMAGVIKLASQWGPSGDITRSVAVGARVGSQSVVAASVVLERLGGLAATSALATAALLVLTGGFETGQWEQSLLVLAGITVVGTVVGVLAFWPPALRRMVRLGRKIPWERLQEPMSKVGRATGLLEGRPTGPVFLAMTFAEQGAPLIILYLLAVAFGFDITFVQIVAVFPIVKFLGRLPFSLDAFGVQEALIVFLFSLAGVSTEVAFALSLSHRVMTLAGLAVGTLGWMALRERYGTGAGGLDEARTRETP